MDEKKFSIFLGNNETGQGEISRMFVGDLVKPSTSEIKWLEMEEFHIFWASKVTKIVLGDTI